MSKEVIIKVRDDLDGSDADETIEFSVRGLAYEIDLSATNVELFEKSLQQFVDAARPKQPIALAATPLSRLPVEKRVLAQRRREIRGWASRNGWPELHDQVKGRIPYDAIEAYQLTHPEVELPPEIVPQRASSSSSKRSRDDLESVTAQEMLTLDGGAAQLMGSGRQTAATTAKENRRKKFGEKLDSLDKDRRAEIRAWANENGFTIGDKGLIKTEILEAYFDAHPEDN